MGKTVLCSHNFERFFVLQPSGGSRWQKSWVDSDSTPVISEPTSEGRSCQHYPKSFEIVWSSDENSESDLPDQPEPIPIPRSILEPIPELTPKSPQEPIPGSAPKSIPWSVLASESELTPETELVPEWESILEFK